MRKAAGLVAVVAMLCCGGGVTYRDAAEPGRTKPADAGSAATEKPLSKARLQSVIEDVTAARGLPLDPPVATQQLPLKQFKARLRTHEEDAQGAAARAKREGLRAGFAWEPPSSSNGGGAPKYEDLVAAYYDAKADLVVLPYVQPSDDLDHRLGIFAHEVQHAVQHRTFDVKETRAALQEDDARLAYLSLTEGDAQLAMAAFIGRRRGIPLRRIVRRATDIVSGIPVSHGRLRGSAISAGTHASGVTHFPYVEGLRFTGDLYRAGGMALVNRAYRAPPTASSHILHPQRYLDGVLPDVIEPLASAPHERRVVDGRWGELRTRLVLAQCTTSAAAMTIAAGWSGDRYVVTRDGPAGHQLRWLLSFRDPPAATAFREALGRSPCNAQRLDGTAGERRGSFWVHSRGRRVAVVRGMSRTDAAREAGRLLALKVTPSQRERLSDAVVPPRQTIARRAKGHLIDGGFTSYWLGLRVPPMAEAKLALAENLELTVDLPKSVGMIALFDFVPAGDSLERLFETVRSRAGEVTQRKMLATGSRSYKGPLGDTILRRWRSGLTHLAIRVIPLCAMTGALVIVTFSADEIAQRRAEAWAKKPRWLVDRRIPACRWLDPK